MLKNYWTDTYLSDQRERLYNSRIIRADSRKEIMKICQVAPEFFPVVGGVTVVIYYLSRAIEEAGHDVAVLAPGDKIKEMSCRFDAMKLFDIPVEEIFLKNLDLEKEKFDFDILHAHFAWPVGYAVALWGKANGVPTVVTCHGIDLNTDRQIDYGFRLQDDLARKIKTTLEEATAVSCVSPFLAEKAIEAGCPEDKLHIIPNGVVLEEFSQAESGFQTEPYILFLGNLRPVKGVDLLLSAFERVARELADIKLYLVGDGEEKNSLLKDSFTKPSLSGRVRFVKQTTGKEKARLFANCLFFVCPSRVESFSIVNLEAMASSKPVVAFDVGGIGELIVNGENGFLISPYDIDSFAKAMTKLAANRELRIKMGQAALKRARNYDWKSIATQYIDLYSSLHTGNSSPISGK